MIMRIVQQHVHGVKMEYDVSPLTYFSILFDLLTMHQYNLQLVEVTNSQNFLSFFRIRYCLITNQIEMDVFVGYPDHE